MKQLISATLSEEAAAIYNGWQRQQKSRILSDLIVNGGSLKETINELQQGRSDNLALLSKIKVNLQLKDGITPLVEEINDALKGTLYWEPFTDEYRKFKKDEGLAKEKSSLEKMNEEAFKRTGKYLF